jgi:hypothetical protein
MDMSQPPASSLQMAEKLQAVGERLAYAAHQLAAASATIESLSLSDVIQRDAESAVRETDATELATDDSFNPQWHGLLGDALMHDSEIADYSRQLIAAACDNIQPALALLARLMLFRAASNEERPPLLREIGESYYRWACFFGVEPEAWRDALTLWLVQDCADTALAPTIELVHVGDRLDSTRHHTSSPGTAVIGVSGWIVLRANGTVYTKAHVS